MEEESCNYKCICKDGYDGRNCNQRYPVPQVLTAEIKKIVDDISDYKDQNVANTMRKLLNATYPRFTFLVAVYNSFESVEGK